MAWPAWLRISVSAIATARPLRRSFGQDPIDAVERGTMPLDAALHDIATMPPPQTGGRA
jgi:hypothetical protein